MRWMLRVLTVVRSGISSSNAAMMVKGRVRDVVSFLIRPSAEAGLWFIFGIMSEYERSA